MHKVFRNCIEKFMSFFFSAPFEFTSDIVAVMFHIRFLPSALRQKFFGGQRRTGNVYFHHYQKQKWYDSREKLRF